MTKYSWSTCRDTTPGAGRLQVHLTDFVPISELHIGFFGLPEAAPVPASSSKTR
ncbi:MAG: hypothetical protein ABSF23_00675 [Terracidiphilus sp.]